MIYAPRGDLGHCAIMSKVGHTRRTVIRMDDAQGSAAGRSLARARWGSQRVDRIGEELAGRVGELSPDIAEILLSAISASYAASRGASPDTPCPDDQENPR